MPEVTIWGIAYRINRLEIRVNGLSKAGNADEFTDIEGFRLVILHAFAFRFPVHDVLDDKVVADLACFLGNDGSLFDRMIVEGRTFREMIFEYKPEFLLLGHSVHLLTNLEAEFRIGYLFYEVVYRRHTDINFLLFCKDSVFC